MIYDNPFHLKGRNIIVSGASSGIGKQVAITCSKYGANVILLGRNLDRLKETSSQLISSDNLLYSLDLRDDKKVKEVIKIIVSKVGRIDGLVNCAGISCTLPLNLSSMENAQNVFMNNVISSFNLTKEVCNYKNISKSGASIVFISSVMGALGEVGKTLYSMSKGAIIAMVRSLACELAPKNIRVNTISPGVIITPINENLPHILDLKSRKKIEEKHLLGLGSTKDVAYTTLFLLSNASKWITGTNIFVDGGYSAK